MSTNNAINNTLGSPFIVGSTSVTSTGTQLNYLNGLSSVPINIINPVPITATGSYTYTPTPGTKYVIAKLQGGAGGVGGCAGATGQNCVTGGGSSGGYIELFITAANLVSCSGSVGVGGAAGAAGNNAGGNGGNTTFVCNGGSTWIAAGGNGSPGAAASALSSASAGGAANGNTSGTNATLLLNINGESGSTGNSPVVSGVNIESGKGANSVLGVGGIGVIVVSNGASAGNPGTGYGSGAGGTASLNNNANTVGSAGQPGIVIFYEFISG